jgi:hypothetical protein
VAVGRTYIFVDIKRNAATNNITVAPNGADKINTVAGSYVIASSGSQTMLTTDAAGNWYATTVSGTTFDPLNISSNLQWVAAQANPTLFQAGVGPASGTAQSVTLKPQGANATNGTPGSFVLNIAAPTGTGSEANFLQQRAGTTMWQSGSNSTITGDAAGGVLWLGGNAAAPSISNWALASLFSSAIQINSPTPSGAIYIKFGATNNSSIWADGWSFFGSSDTMAGGSGVLLINNRTTAPNSNPATAGILYAEAGAGLWRGSGGAVSTFAVTGEGTQNTQAGLWPRRQVFGRTTTTGGTFTVDTPIPTTTMALLRWTVTGRLVSGTGTVGDAGVITQETGYKNVGGVVTRLAGTDNLITSRLDTNFNASAASAPNSTNARITVTAPSSEGATPTIDWTVTVDYIVN